MKLKAWDNNSKIVMDLDFTDNDIARTIFNTFKNASTIFSKVANLKRMELINDDGTPASFMIFAELPYKVPDDRTPEEKEWSKKAKERLGFGAIVYKDGSWRCDPDGRHRELGYGNTPEEAIQDCLDRNKGKESH